MCSKQEPCDCDPEMDKIKDELMELKDDENDRIKQDLLEMETLKIEDLESEISEDEDKISEVEEEVKELKLVKVELEEDLKVCELGASKEDKAAAEAVEAKLTAENAA